MKYAKHIILFTTCSFVYAISLGQRVKLDSLLHLLPSLHDTTRIDCLNALSHEYILTEKKDSASYFSALAQKEAIEGNYSYGVIQAWYNQSDILFQIDFLVAEAETLLRKAITWYERRPDKRGISDLYNQLAVMVGVQSRYNESVAYSRKAYEYAEQTNDKTRMAESIWMTGAAYLESGEYEKAFHFFEKEYYMRLALKDPQKIAISLFSLAQVLMRTENYLSSLGYFHDAFHMLSVVSVEDMRNTTADIWYKMEFAENFALIGQFDSAWHYFDLFKPKKPDLDRIYLVSTGECYYLQKNYRQALDNFLAALPEHEKLNDQNQIMRTLICISKASQQLGKDSAALRYARRGLSLALKNKAYQYTGDAYQIIYSVYDKRGMEDSANFYFRKYTTVNNAVENERIRANLAVQKYNERIALLNVEKETREQKLEQSSIQKKLLIFILVAIVSLGFILIRNIFLKRKNEAHRRELAENELRIQKLESVRTKTELQHQATELEMKALRAQMNPHFIFNSLNSINRFILQNNKKQASEYLTKFSKLVRLILQNSNASLVTLESELEALQLYLELESLRFNHRFNFKISLVDEIDAEVIKVPPLIIQPYAENAIWHGLMHKPNVGNLEIEIKEEESFLQIKISDDGIGRKKAAELKSKSATTHKSMGLKITEDRIAVMNEKGNRKAVIINDLVAPDGSAAGTEVIIQIPLSYD